MSLDVYLELEQPIKKEPSSGIFVRVDGQNREVTTEEYAEMFPGRSPLIVEQEDETTEVYTANITHNLNKMADEAGIYKHLWRPDEIEVERAEQLIEPLAQGLQDLEARPEHYRQFNPENGWGTYEGLVRFVSGYLEACKKYPDAKVSVWR